MTWSRHPEWRQQVLEQLDQAQGAYTLIGPGNAYFPSAALRVSAFVSETDWLLAFQSLAWARRESRYVRDLQLFGIDLGPDSYTSTELFARTRSRFWSEDGHFVADPHDLRFEAGGEEIHLTPSTEDYADVGIDLNEMTKELAVLRYLVSVVGSTLLLTEPEILRIASKESLSQLFSLNGWTHPDEAEDEKPSQVSCFQAMAAAISAGDLGGLEVCARNANTDWRNWTALENDPMWLDGSGR